MTFEELKIESAKLGIVLTDEMLSRFDLYASLLKEWNEKINLTAIVEKEETIEKHFYDCLLLLKYLGNATSLADIGTGAGFPGLVVAIVRSDIQVTLIEPTRKRCIFLQTIKETLALNNVIIVNKRAEECVNIYREMFDIATARAVANLQILAELCIPFVKVGGKFISMKGSQGIEEAEASKKAFKELGACTPEIYKEELPSGAKRIFVVAEKEKETPKQYPRVYAKMKKKPL